MTQFVQQCFGIVLCVSDEQASGTHVNESSDGATSRVKLTGRGEGQNVGAQHTGHEVNENDEVSSGMGLLVGNGRLAALGRGDAEGRRNRDDAQSGGDSGGDRIQQGGPIGLLV